MVARRYRDNIEQLRRIGFETIDRGHNRPKARCLSVDSRKGACIERELPFLSNYGLAPVRSIHLSHALRTGARPRAVGSIPNAILDECAPCGSVVANAALC
jgi:hypothetical protein